MKKKLMSAILAAALGLSLLAGCGQEKTEEPKANEEKQMVLGSVRDMIPGRGRLFLCQSFGPCLGTAGGEQQSYAGALPGRVLGVQ